MHSSIVISVFAAAVLLVTYTASPPQQEMANDTSYFPSKFEVEVGSPLESSYKIELRDGKLHYKTNDPTAKPMIVEKVITPTKEQWRSFWQEATKAQLWQWSQEYFNHDIADGTQWRLRIEYAGKAINAAGSNAYPLEGHVAISNKSPDPSPPFNQFFKAVRVLIGNLPFQ